MRAKLNAISKALRGISFLAGFTAAFVVVVAAMRAIPKELRGLGFFAGFMVALMVTTAVIYVPLLLIGTPPVVAKLVSAVPTCFALYAIGNALFDEPAEDRPVTTR